MQKMKKKKRKNENVIPDRKVFSDLKKAKPKDAPNIAPCQVGSKEN